MNLFKSIIKISGKLQNLISFNAFSFLFVFSLKYKFSPSNFSLSVYNLKQLEQYDLTWIEEPLHPSKLKELKSVYDLVNIPVATGEGLSGKLDFDSYLDSGCVDIIQPDVTHCGGFMRTRKIIEQAKRKGIKVSLHIWGSGISLMANLHLALSMGVDWFEIPMVSLDLLSTEFTELKTMILNKDITLNNGLGIKLTDDVKQSYPFVKNSGYKIK